MNGCETLQSIDSEVWIRADKIRQGDKAHQKTRAHRPQACNREWRDVDTVEVKRGDEYTKSNQAGPDNVPLQIFVINHVQYDRYDRLIMFSNRINVHVCVFQREERQTTGRKHRRNEVATRLPVQRGRNPSFRRASFFSVFPRISHLQTWTRRGQEYVQ